MVLTTTAMVRLMRAVVLFAETAIARAVLLARIAGVVLLTVLQDQEACVAVTTSAIPEKEKQQDSALLTVVK